jgi:hypothetical protein
MSVETEEFVSGEAPAAPKPGVELTKERARLRSLFKVNPNQVHLFTRPETYYRLSVQRWLSDKYVMVNVTGSPALRVPDPPGMVDSHSTVEMELPDGAYKLTAAHGLQPSSGWLVPDTAGLLSFLESRDAKWSPMYRTQWSIADSPAKLMLAYADVVNKECPLKSYRVAVAVNEGIWAAFEAAFPGCRFEWREGDPYRVTDADGRIVGYVAKARVPEDEEATAQRIVGGS